MSVFLTTVMITTLFSIVSISSDASENSFSDAANYTIGKQVSGNISNSNTKDYYKFTLKKSGRIEIVAVSFMEQIGYSVYDSNFSLVDSENQWWDHSKKFGYYQRYKNLTSGTYYFVIKKLQGIGDYNFSINYVSANESFGESQSKHNNSFNDACKIKLNKKYVGQIAENDVTDFYKFELSSSGKIKILAKSHMYWVSYEIYDSSYKRISIKNILSSNNTGVGTYNESIKLKSGTYYFVVSKYISYTGVYNFKISPPPVAPTSVKLNYKKVTTNVGKKLTLKATISPSNATSKTVKWSSSNRKIASVNKKGVVKAVKKGSAVITCVTSNGKKASCKVKVNAEVAAKSIKLNYKKVSLTSGKTVTLKATFSPSNTTNKVLKWTSSNNKIASVNKNGKIKAVKKGNTVITCTTSNGKKAYCKVSVK